MSCGVVPSRHIVLTSPIRALRTRLLSLRSVVPSRHLTPKSINVSIFVTTTETTFLGNLQLPFCVRGGVYNTPVVYVVVILSAKLSSSELFLVVYVVVLFLLVCKIVHFAFITQNRGRPEPPRHGWSLHTFPLTDQRW